MTVELALVIGMGMISFLFAYLSVNLSDKRHGAIQFLFLFVSILTSILNVSMMSQFAMPSRIAELLTGVYSLVVWTFIFTLLYFILYFITHVSKIFIAFLEKLSPLLKTGDRRKWRGKKK